MRALDHSPRSMRSAVRTAQLGLCAARAAEGVLLLAAGALLTAGAALLSRASAGEAWSLAWLGGLLCAATWALEHPCRLAQAARALDRRLGLDGALATAFELEMRRGELRPLELLLRARVLAPLRARTLLGALRPSFVVPLAALVGSAVPFVLVLDARERVPEERVDTRALQGAVTRALDTLASELAHADDAGARATAAAVAELRALLPGATGESPAASAELARAVAELDRRAAALAAGAEPGSALTRSLAESRAWLDALRTALAPAVAAGAAAGDGPLTRGPTQGRISGSNPDPTRPDEQPMSSDTSPPSEPSTPTQQGNWWPAEYDEVVERWLALSREHGEGAR